MTGVIDIEKTRTPVGNVVDLQGVLAGPVSHGLCLANERPEGRLRYPQSHPDHRLQHAASKGCLRAPGASRPAAAGVVA
ncbi:hypothetical protein D3C85_836010 [compost metagenome]